MNGIYENSEMAKVVNPFICKEKCRIWTIRKELAVGNTNEDFDMPSSEYYHFSVIPRRACELICDPVHDVPESINFSHIFLQNLHVKKGCRYFLEHLVSEEMTVEEQKEFAKKI